MEANTAPFDGHYAETRSDLIDEETRAEIYQMPDPFAGYKRLQESYFDDIEHHTNFNIPGQIEAVRLLGVAEVHCKAEVEFLNDMRKVVFAEQCDLARAYFEERGDLKPSQITVSLVESRARTSKEYRKHLDDQRKAKKEWGTAAANYWAARNMVEAMMRSLGVVKNEMYLGSQGVV